MRGFLQNYYAGSVILLAMLLGGGTKQGLWTDHLIEAAMLPALFITLPRLTRNRLPLAAQLFIIGLLLLLLVHFLPWHRSIAIGETIYGGWGMVSPLPLGSLEAALFTVALTGFGLYLARLGDMEQERCLRFVMIGFFVNFVAGLIQLASGSGRISSELLPFTISFGLFANENHFSTLIFMMIPLIAWFHLARNRRPVIYLLFVLLIVSFLFAIGSRAGMAISLGLALLCSFWFMAPRAAFALKVALLLVAATAVGLSLWIFGLPGTIEGELRTIFFTTTLHAILDHFPLGTGLGTFTSIYPSYEPREAIIDLYANHAHNDYLEIVLETGIFGAALLLFFFALLLRHAGRTPLTQAAFIAVAAVALHSVVDYPLRTFAVATPLTLLVVIILSTVPDRRRNARLPVEGQPDFVAHRKRELVFTDEDEPALPERVEPTRKS